MLARLLGVWLFWLSVFTPPSYAEVAIPVFSAWVVDQTQTLSTEQKNTLVHSLQAFEARKGSQLGVIIVASTQPETIEQYSLRVVEQWKLGRKNVDDGALLIVAKEDHSLRIEVGYGLEGVLNDATCKRIISEIITPYFKSGDFYGGIAAGTLQIMQVIDGEMLPPNAALIRDSVNYHEYLLGLFILALMLGAILRAVLGRVFGAIITGIIIAMLAWLLVGVFVTALVFGIFALLLTGFGSTALGAFLLNNLGGGRGGGPGGPRGGGGGFGGGGASGKW